MTIIKLQLIVGLLAILISRLAAAVASDPSAIRGLEGYFGGLPFYTAFHQSSTTRLLLLKAARNVPELKEHLRLSESQMTKIETLQIAEHRQLSDAQRTTLLDENMAIDEDLVDAHFYGFLDETQLESLDRLSVEFDGLAGLTRTSIAKRLKLTPATRDATRKALVSMREQAWLPYFRWEFAAQLPADHEYRKSVFVGKYLILLKQAIAKQLSEDEMKSLAEWLSRTKPPDKVVEAVKRKAPLPNGLFGLVKPKSG